MATELPVGKGNGLDRDCVVNLDDVQTIRRADLGRFMGYLSAHQEPALRAPCSGVRSRRLRPDSDPLIPIFEYSLGGRPASKVLPSRLTVPPDTALKDQIQVIWQPPTAPGPPKQIPRLNPDPVWREWLP